MASLGTGIAFLLVTVAIEVRLGKRVPLEEKKVLFHVQLVLIAVGLLLVLAYFDWVPRWFLTLYVICAFVTVPVQAYCVRYCRQCGYPLRSKGPVSREISRRFIAKCPACDEPVDWEFTGEEG